MKYLNCQKCGAEKTTRTQKRSKLCIDCSNQIKYDAAHTAKRTCVKCKVEKDNTKDFFPYRDTINFTLKAMCRECDNHRRSIDYRNNIDREKNTRLKNHFGISLEDYKAIFNKQNGLCAICKNPPSRKNLAVDHCHKTGKIRGLLCGNCNTGLGKFRDSKEILENAISYLITM